MWLLQCDKRATVCFCAWSCAFFCICRCVFYTQKCHMLVCTSVFSCHFFFFFLRRQCAACTHERKGNIVCSVSLYSGTYQLKGCCLDSLRWGYSVKKQAIQMSEHWGKFFTTHLITENITAEGWVGGTSRGLYCVFFFFYTFTIHTHFLQRHLLNIPRHFTHSSMLSSISHVPALPQSSIRDSNILHNPK